MILSNNMFDEIKTPKHYTNSTIEPFEVIRDWNLNFFTGNVLKYLKRYKHKGNPIKDLEKARQYIDEEIWNLKHIQQQETEDIEPIGDEILK